ncbi:hypothetical protein [Emticicia sp. C21]|uniref:hypothetical protein n=1 Tax=Emticicia sp. C21 TaxID=2302915 RepID=UPI000E35033A|nr:hypothetical protein [Emticicia sp. C21]RFS16089.1 hypothetical protein D0T08_14465 [Emticicia sp. C21]
MESRRYEAQTKQQLSQRYQVSMPTFNKWLNRIPKLKLMKFQKVLTPKEVETIYKYLGESPE